MTRYTLNTLVLFFSLLVLQSQAANMYRYTDNNGRRIVATSVPAEFIKNGYEVLNERGQVIETVSRTLSDEERAARADELEQERLAEEARLKQEEDDRLLLRLYRSPEEVIRRRDSTLGELDDQISVLNALHEDAQEKLDAVQLRIDNNKAADREPTEAMLAQLDDATEERDRLGRQITRLENERTETIETAQQNIDRLKELLNLD